MAALPLLDRAVVAAHRAGFGPITVLASGTGHLHLPRSTALRIPVEIKPATETVGISGLVIGGGTLVSTSDLRNLRPGDVLVERTGSPLPVGFLASPCRDPFAQLPHLHSVPVEGVTLRVRDADEAQEATRLLWRSITSTSDGWVDRWFNRPVGRPLSRLLAYTPVTPNQVSVAATLLGLLAAALFGIGDAMVSIVAALLFQASAVLDCVDGDIARAVFKESPLGKWLDLVGDQVVHIGVFMGIATGVVRAGGTALYGWLGAAAALGAALSFWVVMRRLRQSTGRNGRLQRLLDTATNRDFSVLVLILAAFDALDAFLWLAAIGSHAFWAALLTLQLRGRPDVSPGTRS